MKYLNDNKFVADVFWTSVLSLLIIMLMAMALLKEDPVFWGSAGGWPVWLRDFVRSTFYPLFFFELLSLLIFSAQVFVNVRVGRGNRLTMIILRFLWVLLAIVVGIVMKDNIENLFEGRALHWRP
ncbi:MAG: hypothetical protein ACI9FB_000609 [Candidatus Azotimanducaceae bacterium]|jgi:hypothetical protein